MKKILIIMIIGAMFLCGCGAEVEETGTLDYEKMDKEFGQLKEENEETTGVAEEFNDELPDIKKCAEQYAHCLLEGDARLCAERFPKSFISAIANGEGCSYDTAFEIAVNKIWKNFSKTENKYKRIVSMKDKYKVDVSVRTVKRFSQENRYKQVYKKYDIDVTDIITVDFVITVNGESADADIRFVKIAEDGWSPDMSYFDI